MMAGLFTDSAKGTLPATDATGLGPLRTSGGRVAEGAANEQAAAALRLRALGDRQAKQGRTADLERTPKSILALFR